MICCFNMCTADKLFCNVFLQTNENSNKDSNITSEFDLLQLTVLLVGHCEIWKQVIICYNKVGSTENWILFLVMWVHDVRCCL
jgi:hypothetical protein